MNSPAISRLRRLMLAQWIDEAIALLDAMDGDPDLEDTDMDHENDFEDYEDEKEQDPEYANFPWIIRGGLAI
ncbi:hypothetical protein AAIB41_15280 [Brucella sp. BE17]|uniref:hypothetical protein n=1 Tax=Brucella sp. BE17 TaxID=3142977 RepID=UPI0031BAF1A8